MKCPVCDCEIKKTDKCRNCGFEDIRTEFINSEELEMWQKYVVYPCRFAYKTAIEQSEKMYKKMHKYVADDQIQYSQSAPQFNSLPTPQKRDGWNYSDLVAHPNFFTGEYTGEKFEVFNISGNGDERNYKINFMAKLLTVSQYGNGSGRVRFKWRIKDQDGVIVLNGIWSQEGLLVGDVIKGEISLRNCGKHIYTLDFVNS